MNHSQINLIHIHMLNKPDEGGSPATHGSISPSGMDLGALLPFSCDQEPSCLGAGRNISKRQWNSDENPLHTLLLVSIMYPPTAGNREGASPWCQKTCTDILDQHGLWDKGQKNGMLDCFWIFYCLMMCVLGDITRSAAKLHALFPPAQTAAVLALPEMGIGP